MYPNVMDGICQFVITNAFFILIWLKVWAIAGIHVAVPKRMKRIKNWQNISQPILNRKPSRAMHL